MIHHNDSWLDVADDILDKLAVRSVKYYCQKCIKKYSFWVLVAALAVSEPLLCAFWPVGIIFWCQIGVLGLSTILYVIQIVGVASSEWEKIAVINALANSNFTSLMIPKGIADFSLLKLFLFFSAEGEYILEFACLLGGWILIFWHPGLAILRCFRVFRVLWFYEVDVFKKKTDRYFSPLFGKQFVKRSFKVLKFSIKALSALGNEMFRMNEQTRGGLLLMMIFFYSAFVLGISLWVETKDSANTSPEDLMVLNTSCATVGDCTYTMMRLTFFDGGGFDFAYALTGDHKFLFILAIAYMCVTAFGIMNGLVGIFGVAFSKASDIAFEEDIDTEDDPNSHLATDGDSVHDANEAAESSSSDDDDGDQGPGRAVIKQLIRKQSMKFPPPAIGAAGASDNNGAGGGGASAGGTAKKDEPGNYNIGTAATTGSAEDNKDNTALTVDMASSKSDAQKSKTNLLSRALSMGVKQQPAPEEPIMIDPKIAAFAAKAFASPGARIGGGGGGFRAIVAKHLENNGSGATVGGQAAGMSPAKMNALSSGYKQFNATHSPAPEKKHHGMFGGGHGGGGPPPAGLQRKPSQLFSRQQSRLSHTATGPDLTMFVAQVTGLQQQLAEQRETSKILFEQIMHMTAALTLLHPELSAHISNGEDAKKLLRKSIVESVGSVTPTQPSPALVERSSVAPAEVKSADTPSVPHVTPHTVNLSKFKAKFNAAKENTANKDAKPIQPDAQVNHITTIAEVDESILLSVSDRQVPPTKRQPSSGVLPIDRIQEEQQAKILKDSSQMVVATERSQSVEQPVRKGNEQHKAPARRAEAISVVEGFDNGSSESKQQISEKETTASMRVSPRPPMDSAVVASTTHPPLTAAAGPGEEKLVQNLSSVAPAPALEEAEDLYVDGPDSDHEILRPLGSKLPKQPITAAAAATNRRISQVKKFLELDSLNESASTAPPPAAAVSAPANRSSTALSSSTYIHRFHDGDEASIQSYSSEAKRETLFGEEELSSIAPRAHPETPILTKIRNILHHDDASSPQHHERATLSGNEGVVVGRRFTKPNSNSDTPPPDVNNPSAAVAATSVAPINKQFIEAPNRVSPNAVERSVSPSFNGPTIAQVRSFLALDSLSTNNSKMQSRGAAPPKKSKPSSAQSPPLPLQQQGVVQESKASSPSYDPDGVRMFTTESFLSVEPSELHPPGRMMVESPAGSLVLQDASTVYPVDDEKSSLLLAQGSVTA